MPTPPEAPPPPEEPAPEELEGLDEEQKAARRRQRLTSITSRLDDDHFAVLPHGEQLQGWSSEDVAELNDHVRHMLHSRREKFKRGMKGFWQYVRKRKSISPLYDTAADLSIQHLDFVSHFTQLSSPSLALRGYCF